MVVGVSVALELINQYWSKGDHSDHVLNSLHLLRNFRVAENQSRDHVLEHLKINDNDLNALRFILVESERTPVSPPALGAHLKITSASTTALINRLERAGYLRRDAHPTDRRALYLIATQSARLLLEPSLHAQAEALLAAARSFSPTELEIVERFLAAAAEALESAHK